MAKRKSPPEDDSLVEPAPRRSVRLQKPNDATTVATQKPEPRREKAKASTKTALAKTVVKKPATARKAAPVSQEKATQELKVNGDVAASNETAVPEEGRNYWLLKAEPDSRFENGVDVKFSIDDLAAKKEPEPWDGIRAYAARNNLRAMKKGELAFFYHSNCKEPGIVGTMEIVREHSPDLSAHDPKAPYYDPKSKPDDPKWSVVHVKFRSKFAASIGLKELREMGGPGKPLENMQMLKQSRLSVSRVNPAEWEYLIGVAEERASAT